MQNSFTEKLLCDLADTLNIPTSRYESAERSYNAIGNWLQRDDSKLKNFNPKVYGQGSFVLGTAIKPISEEDEHDVDIVCEVSLSTQNITQKGLKNLLLEELSLYAKCKQMEQPEDKRRCVTLNYADDAKFHIDALISVSSMKEFVNNDLINNPYTKSIISITDKEHPYYSAITNNWYRSNPKGYAEWFNGRKILRTAAMRFSEGIEKLPLHKNRSILQKSVQILKRHRDRYFIENNDIKPISIILTTLSAMAYEGEETLSDSLQGILRWLDSRIEVESGISWVRNPTIPSENFAERWNENPELKEGFFTWLRQARCDFDSFFQADNIDNAEDVLDSFIGRVTIDRLRALRGLEKKQNVVFFAAHRKNPLWQISPDKNYYVKIEKSVVKMRGFRDYAYGNNDLPIKKGRSLKFTAKTNAVLPYDVYWQVVNTGEEAESANQLRGGFDIGEAISTSGLSKGYLIRNETTQYKGTHSIECFIVKDGILIARSGQYYVNIK